MRRLFIIIALLILLPLVHASGLAFKDIAVEVEGDADDNINAAGGSFEASPGDSIELTVEVENDYAVSTTNHKIKRIDVIIDVDTFCSRDLDDSIEEDIRINDLEPSQDDEAVFRFKIPDCANEGNYDLDIQVDGKDEDSTEYVIEETITVGIDKDASSLVMDFTLDSAMTCTNREFSVTVEAHNTGATDDDAGLLIINDDLGINTFEFMELQTGSWTDEDTQFLETYTFAVDDSVESGEYDLRAEIEYASNTKEIKRWLTITVPACETETAVEAEEPAETESIELVDIELVEDVAKETEETETSPETQLESREDAEETSEETSIVSTVVPVQNEENELFSIPILIGALIAGMIVLIIMIFLLMKR